jgi:rare lipoprotein A
MVGSNRYPSGQEYGRMQHYLTTLGKEVGSIDSKLGPKTALAALQESSFSTPKNAPEQIALVQAKSEEILSQLKEKVQTRIDRATLALDAYEGTQQPTDAMKVELQQSLKDLGLYKGKEDGQIGPASKSAISQFKEHNDNLLEGKPTPIKEQGIASYYSDQHHGKCMANMDLFDMNARAPFTAAHKTLPLGSKVKVTADKGSDNEKSIEVKITDRGPYVKDRIIDLNRAGAQALGLTGASKNGEAGLKPVEIEVIGKFPGGPYADRKSQCDTGTKPKRRRKADATDQAITETRFASSDVSEGNLGEAQHGLSQQLARNETQNSRTSVG